MIWFVAGYLLIGLALFAGIVIHCAKDAETAEDFKETDFFGIGVKAIFAWPIVLIYGLMKEAFEQFTKWAWFHFHLDKKPDHKDPL